MQRHANGGGVRKKQAEERVWALTAAAGLARML
jgi:hypothetical protein